MLECPNVASVRAQAAARFVSALLVLAAACSGASKKAQVALPKGFVEAPDAGGVAGSSGSAAPAAGSSAGSAGSGTSAGGAAASAEPNACGAAHAAPGCDDPAVQSCVCTNGDPDCCKNPWDEICVGLVQGLRCKGDCCRATGALGCADATVESCVCALSPDCCDRTWDDFCTIVAEGSCKACSGK